MKCHCPHLGSASDWLIIQSSQMQDLGIYVVTRHQYGLSGACSSDFITRKASGCVAKYRMFSQDNVEQTFFD